MAQSVVKPRRRVGLIVAIVVIVIIVIFGGLYILGGSYHGGNPTVSVNITGINLQISYTGSTSGYLGPTSQALSYTNTVGGGQQFSVTITLSTSAILLSHTINSITVNTGGFALDSISPSIPYTFSPGSSIDFTLTLTAPSSDFNGPLSVLISTS
ncbi:MAG: hypothetical protein M1386_05320 [Candidatus Thermoplasmatota archaeon]|nr:hypothetical protein [Candidatus Thermoplasmatota archaeon]